MPSNRDPEPLIVRIIDPYASLVKTGNYFLGYCPLCHSAQAKMAVRPELDQWHCYSCGAGGDVVDFLSAAEQVTIEEARELLAAIEGRGMEVVLAPSVKAGEAASGVDEKVLRGLFGKLSSIHGFRGAAVYKSEGALVASTSLDTKALGSLPFIFDALLAKSQLVLGDFEIEGGLTEVGIRNDSRKLLRIHVIHRVVPYRILLDLDPGAIDALFRIAVRSYLAQHENQ
jgi:hypothetical protein